jgi:hypothetical protein
MMNDAQQVPVKGLEQSDGTIEYHVLNAETWDDCESLARFIVKEFGAEIIDSLDGICSRTWTFMIGVVRLTLKHHDDIGNYFYSSPRTKEGDALMQRIADSLNARLSES